MGSLDNILISLEPKYAESILAGSKLYELRRRAVRVEPGTTVWFYSKKPEGAVVGYATVADLHEASPKTLWRRYGSSVGISKAEFFDYLSELDVAFAIELKDSSRLKRPVGLDELRKVDEAFQPPQFFKRLSRDETIFRAISEELT